MRSLSPRARRRQSARTHTGRSAPSHRSPESWSPRGPRPIGWVGLVDERTARLLLETAPDCHRSGRRDRRAGAAVGAGPIACSPPTWWPPAGRTVVDAVSSYALARFVHLDSSVGLSLPVLSRDKRRQLVIPIQHWIPMYSVISEWPQLPPGTQASHSWEYI